MNPLDIREGDLIMLPRVGAVPTRRILVISAKPAIVSFPQTNYVQRSGDVIKLDAAPYVDPQTGEQLYDITYLHEDGTLKSTFIRPSAVTLLGRCEEVENDSSD